MGELTAEKVAQRAFDLGLVDERQLAELWGVLGSHGVSVDDLVQASLRRELLTNYQVERLLNGDRRGFFFGDYKVLYYVGAGTFARVYRAVHRKTGQVVAVKVLRNRFSEDPSLYGQFVKEGQLGIQLRHPNIVPTYEVSSRGHTHYLVMEFVEGRNLREFTKVRGKLNSDEAVKLAIDICSGLVYAFERALTHRDLKMTNVLVSSRGQAKLVDFGLASIDDSVDENGEILPNARTIDYAALERATGVRRDDTRSDIYFLGCILYHMLAGKPPLAEVRDRVKRLASQRFRDVVPIQECEPELNPAVVMVVNRAMALDADKRYQAPAAMLADLKVAAKRLLQSPQGSEGEQRSQLAARVSGGTGDDERSVMVVESDVSMQDFFRASFKKHGYRVLVTADPSRAIDRFRSDQNTAQCILFNSRALGESAVEAFKHLAGDPKTSGVPALLLLDQKHNAFREGLPLAGHRAVVPVPCSMKHVRTVLDAMLKARPANGAGS